MPDVIEALRNVRQKCENLEVAFSGTVTARAQLGEAIQDLAGLLGGLPTGLEPVKLLEAAPVVVEELAEKAPPPTSRSAPAAGREGAARA